MIIRYLIRNPLKELYWIDQADPNFTMYPKKATKFKTVEEAEQVLSDKVPAGVYLIDKFYVKQ